jgi:hypothetical protein
MSGRLLLDKEAKKTFTGYWKGARLSSLLCLRTSEETKKETKWANAS